MRIDGDGGIVAGSRFGKLVAVVLAPRKLSEAVRWLCRCDCGAELEVRATSLRRPRGTKSCGCLRYTETPHGKLCKPCGRTLSADAFGKRVLSSGRPGLRRECLECERVKGATRRDYYNRWLLATKYGITPEEHAAMRERANYRCEICGKHESEERRGRLHIDHCHATGRARGLLCMSCNTAVGHMRDDPALLERAIGYLRAPLRGQAAQPARSADEAPVQAGHALPPK